MNDLLPVYSSRLFRLWIEYASKNYPDIDIDSILRHAKMTQHEVADPGHWFNQRQSDRFYEMLVSKTNNPDIARLTGRMMAESSLMGPVKQNVMGLLDTNTTYASIARVYPTLSRGAHAKARRLGKNRVEITVWPNPDIKEKSYQCEYRMGSFEAIAKAMTGQLPQFEQPACVHNGDNRCQYIIAWKKTPDMIWRQIRNYSIIIGALVSLAAFFVLPISVWLPIPLMCVCVWRWHSHWFQVGIN